MVAGSVGIMSDPRRTVHHDDTLIFVSSTSSPTPAVGADRADFRAEAAPFLVGAHGNRLAREAAETKARGATRVLLCGWRQEWDREMERFKDRIRDISMGMAVSARVAAHDSHSPHFLSFRPLPCVQDDSSITCLNVKSHAEFRSLLEGSGLGFNPIPLEEAKDINATIGASSMAGHLTNPGHEVMGWRITEVGYHHVIILHFQGNPIKEEQVRPLLQGRTFNAAICLGSVAGKDLGLEAMDSRILSMLLLLRKLSRETQRDDAMEMHIIAENFMDQTASLAVVPQALCSHEPDFVNTVAIKSRSLAMTLAYPEIQVTQLSYPT